MLFRPNTREIAEKRERHVRDVEAHVSRIRSRGRTEDTPHGLVELFTGFGENESWTAPTRSPSESESQRLIEPIGATNKT